MASFLDDISSGLRSVPRNMNIGGAASAIGDKLGQLRGLAHGNSGAIGDFLQTAGRALSPDVYQQWKQAQQRQRELVIQGTISAIENGSIDPAKGTAVLQKMGIQIPDGAGFGPGIAARKAQRDVQQEDATRALDAQIRSGIPELAPNSSTDGMQGNGLTAPTVTTSADPDALLKYADQLKRSGNPSLVDRGLKLEKDIRETLKLENEANKPQVEEIGVGTSADGRPIKQKAQYNKNTRTWDPIGKPYVVNPLAQVTNNIGDKVETAYGKTVGEQLGKKDVDLREAAVKTPELADRSNRILEILDSGKVITGAGADFRLAFAKAAKLAGYDDPTVANTETLAADLANQTLGAVRASGLGAGNGFSNTDRTFVEKAAGGTINLDSETLRRLATIAHRVSELSAEQWNKRAPRIPKSAVEGTGMDVSPIKVPPIYTNKLKKALEKYGDKK